MKNTEEILNSLNSLISRMRKQNEESTFSVYLAKQLRRKLNVYIKEAVDLEKDFIQADEKTDILELKKKFYELENSFFELRIRMVILPGVFFSYLGICSVVILIKLLELPTLIKDTFEVDAPVKLITFGLAGALLYLATRYLSIEEELKNSKYAIPFFIRIAMAIIVPILLVALFFDENGELSKLEITPELISFACGYSSKLVVDIFDKLVEKGSKIIESI